MTALRWLVIAAAVAGCGSGDDGGAADGALADATLMAPDTAVVLPDAALPDAAPPDAAVPVPGCFTGGTMPQLDLSGPVANWTWNDPHVIKVGAGYAMYASATDYFRFPVRLYRLTSADAVTWAPAPATPILDVAAAGQWDAGGVETPAVVFWKGQYHLFYTGYRYPVGDPMHAATDYRVGHAVSADGISFTRRGSAPVVTTSGTDADASNDWYGFVVAEPAPVVKNDVLYLYFTAIGIDPVLGTLQVIGVTTSTDGMAWTPPELALRPDQALYPRGQDWIGYSTPNALVLAGETHLFFDVAHQPAGGEWKQLRIHHARSVDGRSGWIHDAVAIRSAGDFRWAVSEIRAPHALVEGSLLRLWVAGHELDGTAPDHFAIGMLTCDLTR